MITDDGHLVHIAIVAPDTNSLKLSISAHGANVEIITLPNAAYLRANAAFWRPKVGARADGLANRWLQVPPDNVRSVSATLGRFAPATLARCLAEDHGTLSIAGRTTVDGRSAIVLKDAGNVPGSSPGELAVAASGPPYSLPQRPTPGEQAALGGQVDTCNDGKGGDSTRPAHAQSLWHRRADETAPQGAIRLDRTASA